MSNLLGVLFGASNVMGDVGMGVGLVLMGVMTLVLATWWTWLPILLIVLHHKKKKAEQEKQEVVQEVVRGKATVAEGEQKIGELNKKIYAELEKSEPDMEQLKKWRKEIEQIKVANASVNVTGVMGERGEGGVVKKQNYQGLNVLLYVGSLLIVAGRG